ncbi:MAG: MBL fold metallo-hydrolase [Thermodesulfobacteriota bacterium]|nr:MBL fold metallo-hydrolase [Thermodesulfobacteriota bacterium]
MNMRFCVLASGSKGNAVWIEAGGEAVLVDAGLPGRELIRRMTLAGLEPDRLKAILVTHEHRDHILGVGVLARRLGLPVYINEAALDRSRPIIGDIKPRLFSTGTDFAVGELQVHPFSLSHDAADPIGLTFERNGTKLGLATDLGTVTNLVRERLSGCRALILEANYDDQMLTEGPYPWETKRRVRGRRGHLSNENAAELLADVAHAGLIKVVLAHLSQTNNIADLALQCLGQRLKAEGWGWADDNTYTPPASGLRPPGLKLEAADQNAPGKVTKI